MRSIGAGDRGLLRIISDAPARLLRHGRLRRRHPPPIGRFGGTRWSRLAFTLIELMIVVAIIGTLAAMAIPAFSRMIERTKVLRAVSDIKAISMDIEMYEMEHGQVPDSLADIGRDHMRDPWGNPYEYFSFATEKNWKGKARKDHSMVPVNSTYDLYSRGRNGRSASPLPSGPGSDDIVRAHDGGFVGLASEF